MGPKERNFVHFSFVFPTLCKSLINAKRGIVRYASIHAISHLSFSFLWLMMRSISLDQPQKKRKRQELTLTGQPLRGHNEIVLAGQHFSFSLFLFMPGLTPSHFVHNEIVVQAKRKRKKEKTRTFNFWHLGKHKEQSEMPEIDRFANVLVQGIVLAR